jgi:hypothetical protein
VRLKGGCLASGCTSGLDGVRPVNELGNPSKAPNIVLRLSCNLRVTKTPSRLFNKYMHHKKTQHKKSRKL